MKKKVMLCDRHDLTLFRCKRKCWQRRGKDKIWFSEYTEKCFKCISEEIYKKVEKIVEKKKHVKI